MSLIHFPLRVSDDAEIVEADGSVLGHVVWHDNSPNGQWKENADERAAEIVHRCNAHDALIELVRDAAGPLTVGLREAVLARLAGIEAR